MHQVNKIVNSENKSQQGIINNYVHPKILFPVLIGISAIPHSIFTATEFVH